MTAERIQAPRVADITGLSLRTVQLLTAAGKVPSAARFDDHSRWTYDEAAIRRWVRQREAEACQKISTDAPPAGSGTAGSGSPAESYERAYELAMSRKRSGASKRGRTSIGKPSSSVHRA